MTKSEALKLEYRVKKVPAGKKKNELTKGEGVGTINADTELLVIKKEFKVLSRKIKKLMIVVEKLEKENPIIYNG